MISLKQVQEMKPKNICCYQRISLTDEAFEFVHEAHEINCCDMCDFLDSTYELIWIVEDYSPLSGEMPSAKFFEKWEGNALCEACYADQLSQLK